MARDPSYSRDRRARLRRELEAEGFSPAVASRISRGHRQPADPTLAEVREAQESAFPGETAAEALRRARWARRVLAGTGMHAQATYMRHALSVASRGRYRALLRILQNTYEIDPQSYVYLDTDGGGMHDPAPVSWVLEEFLPSMGGGDELENGADMEQALQGFNARYGIKRKPSWTLDVWMPGEGRRR